jgi:hypothetical protein
MSSPLYNKIPLGRRYGFFSINSWRLAAFVVGAALIALAILFIKN